MIKGVFIINNHGQPRAAKFYEQSRAQQQQLIGIFFVGVKRPIRYAILDGDQLSGAGKGAQSLFIATTTLYFVFACENTESELILGDSGVCET